jgi:hypothetical protein
MCFVNSDLPGTRLRDHERGEPLVLQALQHPEGADTQNCNDSPADY